MSYEPLPGPPQGSARVLIVEDDPETRELLAASLRRAGYVVKTEENGYAVESSVATFAPDVALLDLRLAGGPDGLTVARRLRARSAVPVLMVSGSIDVDDRVAALEAGCDDFILKPIFVAELLARITAVLRRAGRVQPSRLVVDDLIIDVDRHTAVRGEELLHLTNVEFLLLTVLARHPGRVFSKRQLLRDVWGYEHFDVNLVEVYVSSLRKKLEEHGPRIVHTVRGVGYVLGHDPSRPLSDL
jgi:DNA-binding response OmpR family regulator